MLSIKNISLSQLDRFLPKKNILLAILTLVVFFSSPIYSTYSEKYIDENLKNAVITYATIRSLNAGVSVIQESSISLSVGVGGNIAIGQALDPINDALERFSDMVTLSIWVLGTQKALYEISNTNFIYYLIVFLAISALFIQHKLLTKLLVVMIVLRLFIPFSAITSHYFNEEIFNPKMQKSLDLLSNYTQPPIKLKLDSTDSIWNTIGSSVNNAKQSLSEFINSVKFYVSNSSAIMTALLDLSVLYVGKYLLNLFLLPLFFIYIIRNLIDARSENFI